MIFEVEKKLTALLEQINLLKESEKKADKLLYHKLLKDYDKELNEAYKNLTPSDRVYLARHPKRPNAKSYINRLFDDFFEQSGDRLCGEDKSIIGGIASFKGTPVTVIAHKKGSTLEENIECNFGMPTPSGYRKVQRIAKQAEKFNRPIITFIDTPGAYPGIDAEKQGQGEAIAQCLALFSDLTVPVIAVVIGEGGSGGALALGVANTIIMLENSVYSILSPEGFASILWKDGSRKDEAAEVMKLTANDLENFGVIDHIIFEGVGSVIKNQEKVMLDLEKTISKELAKLKKHSKNTIKQLRYDKFRAMGTVIRRSDERD